jgi:hypothetical protein
MLLSPPLSCTGSQPIVLGYQPIVVGKAATGGVAVPLAPAIVPIGAGVMGEPIPTFKNAAGGGFPLHLDLIPYASQFGCCAHGR